MFRPMRRYKQALTPDQCVRLLEREPRGVLSVHGEDGYPYGFPMDHLYLDGKLYFHCAREGHKLDALSADDRVSYCVMDQGFRRPGEWALNIQSVILFGRIRRVADPARREHVARLLGLKYDPSPQSVEEELARSLGRAEILELTVDHMTGKLVNES